VESGVHDDAEGKLEGVELEFSGAPQPLVELLSGAPQLPLDEGGREREEGGVV
jgi:hypothetical protein